MTHADTETGVELLRAAHRHNCLWRCVPDGFAEAVAELRARGVPVGVVSNAEGNLQQILDRLELGTAFDVVLDSALEGVHKPDPEIFLRACQRLGVSPATALYAGDIPDVDVRGASDAGLRAALIDPHDAYPTFDEAPRYRSVVELIHGWLTALGPARR
jgi:HAD superfamily hydrolase (TIGR01509 family)